MIATLITFIAFISVLRIVAFLVTKNEVQVPEPCTRHEWTKAYIDSQNHELGTYLVCAKCRQLVTGDFEEGKRG